MRIKALAAFCEKVGPITRDSSVILDFWTGREVISQLRMEAAELGMQEKTAPLKQYLNAWNGFAEIMLDEIDEQDPRDLCKAVVEKVRERNDEG